MIKESPGDKFCKDLARITAKHLRKVPPRQREERLVQLQDCTSLYQPYTAELIEKHLAVRHRGGKR